MATISTRPDMIVRFTLGGAALVYGAGALAIASDNTATTYAGRSQTAAILALTTGLALVTAAIVLCADQARFPLADLALLSAFTWWAPVWAGWAGGPALARGLGEIAGYFTLPLLLHLILIGPDGGVGSRPARTLTVVAYVEAAIAAGGLALFRDPFFDPHCWDDCTGNVFVVDRVDWLADALHREHVWFAAIAALAAAVVALRRLVRATRVARRVTWGVAAGAAVLAVATVIYAVALTRTPLEDPGRRSFSAAFMLTCAAVDLIAISLVGGVARAHARRRSIARITAELGAASQLGSLDAALGTAIDDPTVRIAYWLPGPQRYIDHQGRPVDEPRATPDRQVTPILRGGRRIALVDHHLIGDVDIARAIGPAMLLAFENERLRAEILARVHELERSRARIVQAGDAERSRLERDLHDGAQAFLVAVINDVGVAHASATREGDLRTAALVAEAAAAARSAFSELRELAAGIHPTVLAEAGLEPALATLGDTASIPVELRAMPGCRFAADVEMAAYVVAADALRDASRRGATYVTIDIAADRNGMLIVEVVDDGPERRDALVRAADRVGAVGGRVVDRPSGLRAEIPCG